MEIRYFMWSICALLFLQVKCTHSEASEVDKFSSKNQSDPQIIVTPSVKNLISNISNDHNIFNTLFDLGSVYDLLKTLDSIDTKVDDISLNNITSNLTDSQKILYYNIFAEQDNEEIFQHQFEYNLHSYPEIKFQLKPHIFAIKGSFQLTSNYTSIIIRGKFNLKLECPTLVNIDVTTGAINLTAVDSTKKCSHSSQIALEPPSYWDRTISRALDTQVEGFISKILDQNFDDSIRKKIAQFGRAFRFLPLLLSSQLNEIHVISAIRGNLLGTSHLRVTLGPILIQGLNNVKHVNTTIFKMQSGNSDRIGYNMTVKFGDVRGIYDWHFQTGDKIVATGTSKFSISDLTIIADQSLTIKSTNSTYSTWVYNGGRIDVTYNTIESHSTDSTSNSYEKFSESVLSSILNERLRAYLRDLLEARKFIE